MTLVDVPSQSRGAVKRVVAVLAREHLPRVGSEVFVQGRLAGAGPAADGAYQLFRGRRRHGGGGGDGGSGGGKGGGGELFGRQGRGGEDGDFGLLKGEEVVVVVVVVARVLSVVVHGGRPVVVRGRGGGREPRRADVGADVVVVNEVVVDQLSLVLLFVLQPLVLVQQDLPAHDARLGSS